MGVLNSHQWRLDFWFCITDTNTLVIMKSLNTLVFCSCEVFWWKFVCYLSLPCLLSSVLYFEYWNNIYYLYPYNRNIFQTLMKINNRLHRFVSSLSWLASSYLWSRRGNPPLRVRWISMTLMIVMKNCWLVSWST